MKICILTHCYPTNKNPIGGNFIPEFAYELIKQGHKITILTPKMRDQIPIDFGIPVITFDWLGGEKLLGKFKLYNPMDLVKLLSLVMQAKRELSNQDQDIDMCFACWTIPSGISAYLAGVPYSVWSLGSDIHIFINNPIGRILLKAVFGKAKIVFANNFNFVRKIRNLTGKMCYFIPSIRRLSAKARKTNIDKGKFNFVFVGRLERVKGIDILIDAIIELNLDIMLYILGDGSLRSSLEKKVKSVHLSDKIIFKGFADADIVAGYIRDADYLIIPSRSEGMPVVFWEAMQTGTRVIGTDVGDLGYWINKLNAGKVVPPNDKIELMGAILECARRKPTLLGKIKIPTAKDSAKIFLDAIK